MALLVLLVDRAQQVQPQALHMVGNRGLWIEVQNGRARMPEMHSLVSGWQVAARPVARAVDRKRRVISQYDVAWEIVVFGAQRITYPGADRGAARHDPPRVHVPQCLLMVVVL